MQVVTAINDAIRFTVTVTGIAATASPALSRSISAVMRSAPPPKMVLALEQLMRNAADLVATVGRLDVLPGATTWPSPSPPRTPKSHPECCSISCITSYRSLSGCEFP